MQRREIRFASDGATLAGELLLPAEANAAPFPALLLIGGTFSETRDGDPALSLIGRLPTHGMLRVIAEHLAQNGIASLRWDKRGVAASGGGQRDMWSDVGDAEQALHALANAPQIDPTRLFVLGESAGGHTASFLAQRTDLPRGYVLQAALYTSMVEMIRWNYQRTLDYHARGAAEAAWVEQTIPDHLRSARHWRDWVAAAQRGDDTFTAGTGDDRFVMSLRRFKQELAHEPADQFRYIQKPTLVIQGERDLNVPPDDCRQIVAALHAAGNTAVTLVTVPAADHSMQLAPDDEELRLRERVGMGSFARPYSAEFLNALVQWIDRQI